jgi:hypothetical protein
MAYRILGFILSRARSPGCVIFDCSSQRILVIIIVKFQIGNSERLSFQVMKKVLVFLIEITLHLVTKNKKLIKKYKLRNFDK